MRGFFKPLIPVQFVSFASAFLVTAAIFESIAMAETKANTTQIARGLVQQALQHEAAGKIDERNRLLAEAVAKAPDLAAAQWALGLIRDGQRGWVTAEEFAEPALLDRLDKYEAQREKATDSVVSQLSLAQWCHKLGLLNQEKAHLSRIIELEPDHEEARTRLGFTRTLNGWENQADTAAARQREEIRQKHLTKWLPRVSALRLMLTNERAHQRAVLDQKLLSIRDPEAIPAIEQQFMNDRLEVARPALTALSGIADPAASIAIARFAVMGQDPTVRDDAGRRLIRRNVADFVPPMLAAMHVPAKSQWRLATTPDGRLLERQTFTREGQEQKDVLVLDTSFVRADLGLDARVATAKAILTARDDISQRQAQLRTQNQFDEQLNQRITDALNIATVQQLSADPAEWWKWWNDRNEVQVEGAKSINGVYQSQQVVIVDELILPRNNSSSSSQSTVVQERRECLAAGTPVWTIRGPREIETIRAGDMVLSQHPDTGELAYRSVLKATTRPRTELKAIRVNGETWNTTGGHQFWVSGRAWVKASDLQAGDILHAMRSPISIGTMQAGPSVKTYNLVVDDFHTYFVGAAKVLTHDFTSSKATRSIVPGLLTQ